MGAPGTRFRWVQIDGPPVAISDPLKPSIQIIIPQALRSWHSCWLLRTPKACELFG